MRSILKNFTGKSPCLLLVALVFGCSAGNADRARFSTLQPVQPAVQHPSVPPRSVSNEPIQKAAEAELGVEVAQQIPPQQRELPRQAERGALAMFDAIASSISQDVSASGAPSIQVIVKLRNQSRAASDEFSSFEQRLAQLLNDAANQQSPMTIKFTTRTDRADYELHGCAYLISAGGFDMWEIFPRISSISQNWTRWESSDPIRILRHPRPGQPQIISWN